MRKHILALIAFTMLIVVSAAVTADELTMMVEQDLAKLGYETGPVDGEETIETVIAISKFQAENGLEVDGEVSQQLARSLIGASASPSIGATSATASAPKAVSQPDQAMNATALRNAQNRCLQDKIAAAQNTQKKKRGFGRLLRAVTRHATGQDIARTAGDVYRANATAEDLSAAAKDLGLTQSEVEACQNP